MPDKKNTTLGQLVDLAARVDERLDALEGGTTADKVSIDNAANGLAATNVQAAIDELAGKLGDGMNFGELDAFLAEVVGGG